MQTIHKWILSFLMILGVINTRAQTFDWIWANSAKGLTDIKALSIASDSYGNVFMAGYFLAPSVSFDSLTLNGMGLSDAFIAKYDANGHALWAKAFSGHGRERIFSIATDHNGNVYFSGYFDGPWIIIDHDTLHNEGNFIAPDMFVAKMDSNGHVLWINKPFGQVSQYPSIMTTLTNGDIIISGYFSGKLYFDNILLNNKDTLYNTYDIFIVKYTSDGQVVWAKSAGGTDGDIPYSVVNDSSNNIYLTGTFSSPVLYFDGNSLQDSGLLDMFIAKYNSSGDVLWAKNAGGIHSEKAEAVICDDEANVYVGGYFAGLTVTFGSHTLIRTNPALSRSDIFIVKFDPDGNVVWAKNPKGNMGDEISDLAIDKGGNLLVSGFYNSDNLYFDSIKIQNAKPGWFDAFLAAYSPNGTALWATNIGGTNNDRATAMDLNASGDILLCGNFYSPTLSFGSDTLNCFNPNLYADAFIAKYDGITALPATIHSSSSFSLYPNPNSGNVNIDFKHVFQEITVNVYDLRGILIYSQAFYESNKLQLNLSIPDGVYMFELKPINRKSIWKEMLFQHSN